jgi:hypothetical protein
LNLNLGCGEQYAPGWINVDHEGSPHRRDQTVDLTRELPWPENSVDLVYAGHLLEHLTFDQCRDLLIRLRACVKLAGFIMVVGPDVEIAARMEAAGEVLEVPLEQLKYGAGRWAGDEHKWECTLAKLTLLLVEAGWVNVTGFRIDEVSTLWPVAFRGPRWQVAVRAEAPL